MADEQKILTAETEETVVNEEAILPTENNEIVASTEAIPEAVAIVSAESEPIVAEVVSESEAIVTEAPIAIAEEPSATSEPMAEPVEPEATTIIIESQPEPIAEVVEVAETVDVPAEVAETIPAEEAVNPETTSEEITENKNPEAGYEKAKVKSNTIIAIVIALVVVLGLVYYMTKDTKTEQSNLDDAGGKVTVSDKVEQGKVTIIEEVKSPINIASGGVSKASDVSANTAKMPVTVFVGNTRKNSNSADCAQVYPVNRQAEKRYESNMINTVLSLLEPLSSIEKENGYISVIPAGTLLKYIKIDDLGVATANFTGAISKAAGSCAVTAIKSQIRNTLIQFASVKSVVICIDGNCNQAEILQP